MTIVFAVVGYGLYLFLLSSCKEQVAHETKPVTIKETVATVRQNRPLLILCVSNLVFLTGIFGLQAAQAYFAAYILGNSSQLIWMVVARRCPPSLPCRLYRGSSRESARRTRSSSAPLV